MSYGRGGQPKAQVPQVAHDRLGREQAAVADKAMSRSRAAA